MGHLLKVTEEHEKKFAPLFEKVAAAEENNETEVVVESLAVLGDSFNDIVKNLNVLNARRLRLRVEPKGGEHAGSEGKTAVDAEGLCVQAR